MKMKSIYIFAALLCNITFIYAQDTSKITDSPSVKKPYWFVPSYINLQYAGNTGMLSANAGYYLYKDKLYWSFGYGYTPSNQAGRDIHNGIFRLGYKPWSIDIKLQQDFILTPFFVNLTVTKQLNSKYTWSELPNYYPKDYYHQNAVRLHLDFGVSLKHGFKKFELETYYYVTTNDVYVTYVKYYYHDSKLYLHKIFSSAIGLNFIFF